MIQAMAREFAETRGPAHRRRDRPRGALPARDRQADGRARAHGHRGARAWGGSGGRHRLLRGGAGGDRARRARRTRSSCRSTTRSTAIRCSSSGPTRSASSFLKPVAAGQAHGCFALTEPAGRLRRDATRPRWPGATASTTCSTAARCFITNGREASFALVFCQTDSRPAASRHHRLPRREGHAGLLGRQDRGQARHPRLRHRRARLRRLPRAGRVPARRGGPGIQDRPDHARRRPHRHRRPGRRHRRRRLRARSVAYARERKAFGVPIGQHQMVQWMLADMATAIEAPAC